MSEKETAMTDPQHQTPQPAARLPHFPVPFFASVMGLTGLSLALHATEMQAGWPGGASRVVLIAAIATFLTLGLIYTLKALRHPQAVQAEWRHPVKLAFFPAISISLLLIATALTPDMPGAARLIWLIGAVSQAGLTLAVISAWIGTRSFQMTHVTPAWFIPAVGNVVAPVAGVKLGFADLSWLFFAAGLTFWVILLVVVMVRLVFHDPLPGKMVPTLAILIAPPAVALLAWLQLNGGQVDAFARYLYGAAIVFAALVITQAGKLRGVPFALSWWALSFPIAALTIATLRFGALTGSHGHVLAANGLLALLIAIIGTLLLFTARAVMRGEICQPE